jgi:hypothetical protein
VAAGGLTGDATKAATDALFARITAIEAGSMDKLGIAPISMPVGVHNNGQPVLLSSLANRVTDGTANWGTSNYAGIANQANGFTVTDNANVLTVRSPTTLEFCIPIYSGIIGILMPEKKFLPMSMLPLELEFTMNPYAFYGVGDQVTDRKYVVRRFEIWTHTLFFEQELHRSLEAIVAEAGIFIHYQSFYLAPINTYNATAGQLPQYN